MLAGQAKAPSQYRLMVPILAEGLQALGVPFRIATVGLRLAFTWVAALLLHLLLRRWFAPAACLIGTLLLFAALPLTHIIYQLAWTDPANLAFTIAALIVIADRRDGWLAPVIALGMLNRETMLLIPLVWLLYRWDELPLLRCAATFGGYVALAYAVYYGLRASYGPIPHAGVEFFSELGRTPLAHNLTFVRGYAYTAVLFAVPGYLAVRDWSTKPKFMRRALLYAPLFALFHLFVAVFLEPRLMLPIFPVVVAPALASLFPARAELEPEPRTWPPLLRASKWAYVALLASFVMATHAIGYRLTHGSLPFWPC